MVSASHGPRRMLALARAERDKSTTYPELADSDVVAFTTLACEDGGRWIRTCVDAVAALATARARDAPRHLQLGARLARERRPSRMRLRQCWWTTACSSLIATTPTGQSLQVFRWTRVTWRDIPFENVCRVLWRQAVSCPANPPYSDAQSLRSALEHTVALFRLGALEGKRARVGRGGEMDSTPALVPPLSERFLFV